MNEINEIIKNNPELMLWENQTIDWEFTNEKTFSELLKECKCKLCDNSIMKGKDELLSKLSPHTKAIHATCNKCTQKYFLRQKIESTTPANNNNWESVLNK